MSQISVYSRAKSRQGKTEARHTIKLTFIAAALLALPHLLFRSVFVPHRGELRFFVPAPRRRR